MTQEEKQLLLIDLCARLPYELKCVFHSKNGDIPSTIVTIDIENEMVSNKPDGQSLVYVHSIDTIKPYLRPMSSMTEEERIYFQRDSWFDAEQILSHSILLVDWLNEHHFDYRGLIPKGLALEAPEGMYNV